MPVVEADALRAQLGAYHTPPEQFRTEVMRAWQEAVQGCARAVILVGPPGAGKSYWLARQPHEAGVAYLDSTNTWPATRAQAKRIAQQAGCSVQFVVFRTPLSTCLERRRGGPVPPEQIERQWRELERATIE